jgi:hypothetical protein
VAGKRGQGLDESGLEVGGGGASRTRREAIMATMGKGKPASASGGFSGRRGSQGFAGVARSSRGRKKGAVLWPHHDIRHKNSRPRA